MDGASPLPVRIVASGAGGADPNLGAALQLLGLLSAVWGNPYEEPAAVRLRLDARVVPEVVAYEVEDVQFDRRGLRPGDELELRVGVRRHRGPREVRTVRLRLPDSGPGPRRLQLAIGGPTEIERVIGTPLARRLESATDLASTVRVYADLPPAGRVQAVLLEPGGTIVSDGVAWDHLPASAARLLATERSAAESRRPAAPTVLASAHFDLDGPVTGSTRAVVRLDGSNGPSKESSP